MTPTDLAEYARVLKDLGVAQFALRLDRDKLVTELSVVFAPSMPALPDAVDPTPGGWKAATGDLDAPMSQVTLP